MSIDISMNLTDNSKLVREALDEQIEQALIAVGMMAESYAKLPEKNGGHMPVDTGRLKNSITYAIAGQAPNIQSYQADNSKDGEESGGIYAGVAPQDRGGKPRSVYIGSNVSYASDVENGVVGKQAAHHFLRSALSDHTAEYKDLVEKALKGQ